MKILYHHRTLAEDGQAVHIRALQRAFVQEGCELEEVSLVARREGGDGGASRWRFMTQVPRFVRELGEYAYSGVAKARILSKAVHYQPDFLYERYAFGNAAGVRAAHALRRPLVLEVNSPMVLELSRTRGLSFPRLARRLEDWIFQAADRVCVVTEVLADMLRSEHGVDPERLVVTPNGVDLERFDDVERGRALGRLGLTEIIGDAAVLGFVGYYRDWHRLDLVIEGLAEPDLCDAHLVVVGEGPAHDDLVALAERRGVRARVHFTGPRAHDEIPGLLGAFDVALVPAINPYASPLKLHEYMAAGLAVVAPDQPNLRETLTHDENALLVPAGDGEALVAACTDLVGDPERRRRLGRAARATIEERDMTWRGNARRVLAAVGECLP